MNQYIMTKEKINQSYFGFFTKQYEMITQENGSKYQTLSILEVCHFCNQLSELYGYMPFFKISKNSIKMNMNSKGFRIPFLSEIKNAIGVYQSYYDTNFLYHIRQTNDRRYRYDILNLDQMSPLEEEWVIDDRDKNIQELKKTNLLQEGTLILSKRPLAEKANEEIRKIDIDPKEIIHHIYYEPYQPKDQKHCFRLAILPHQTDPKPNDHVQDAFQELLVESAKMGPQNLLLKLLEYMPKSLKEPQKMVDMHTIKLCVVNGNQNSDSKYDCSLLICDLSCSVPS